MLASAHCTFGTSDKAFMPAAPAATTMGKQCVEDADLFDHIDDLLDFDGEAEEALLMVEPCGDRTGAFLLPPLPPPPPPQPAPVVVVAAAGEESVECSGDPKPCDALDIVGLEWAPTEFLDDDSVSFFLDGIDIPISDAAIADDVDAEMPHAKPAAAAAAAAAADACFRTSSPVSVLEANNTKCSGNADSSSSSSSSSSSTSNSYLGRPPEPPSATPTIPARARSKRRRPATFSPRPIITAAPAAAATSDPESSGESFPPPPPPEPKKRKGAKKNPVPAAASADHDDDEEEDDEEWGGSPPPPTPPTARKCMHCGIQKTPQWRAGPMGPKTLCNACGVRYKSGRLFPEYRPAASPTFVPSLHSNSHKKVVEMRNKATSGADGCDLLEYIRRRH